MWMMSVGLLLTLVSLWCLLKFWHWVIRLLLIMAVVIVYAMLGGYQAMYHAETIQNEAQVMATSLADPVKAREILDRMKLAAMNHSDSSEAWFWYGRIAMRVEAFDQAKDALAHAYELAPNSEMVAYQYMASLIAHEGVLSKSYARMIPKLLKQFESSTHFLFLHAEVLLAQDQRTKALAIIDRIKKMPMSQEQKASLASLSALASQQASSQ